MDASFIKKIFGIFKYIFSSMTTIELFIFSLLLFTLLIVNLSRKEKIINIGFIGIYLVLFLCIFVSYFDYVRLCFRLLTKSIMKYYYFPSTIVYFFIVLFSIIMILYSIFKKKLVKWKKIFNYAVFNIIYFLFMLFVTEAASKGIELNDMKALYTNNNILFLVQISNLLLLFWIIVTLFYKLYLYFKKKFD